MLFNVHQANMNLTLVNFSLPFLRHFQADRNTVEDYRHYMIPISTARSSVCSVPVTFVNCDETTAHFRQHRQTTGLFISLETAS